jgi:hypothetical protein
VNKEQISTVIKSLKPETKVLIMLAGDYKGGSLRKHYAYFESVDGNRLNCTDDEVCDFTFAIDDIAHISIVNRIPNNRAAYIL